jgi:1-phosphofructokinase
MLASPQSRASSRSDEWRLPGMTRRGELAVRPSPCSRRRWGAARPTPPGPAAPAPPPGRHAGGGGGRARRGGGGGGEGGVAGGATGAVLAPAVAARLTIERGRDGRDDIHLHPGGQGVWIARMLRLLGERPAICTPIGGEAGRAFVGLLATWNIHVHGVATTMPTPVDVLDRRGGERQEIARSPMATLDRHEIDELYQHTLEAALTAGTCVVTGPTDERMLPMSFYRRLAADLATTDVQVVGDLHGEALDAFLEGGAMTVLKVSAGDLVSDDRLREGDLGEDVAASAALDLAAQGIGTVVLSRGEEPMLVASEVGLVRVRGPVLEAVDPMGSGDSMTAALAASTRRGLDREAMLRRAWAAGAANVSRHGLGSADPALIDRLADRVTIEEVRT